MLPDRGNGVYGWQPAGQTGRGEALERFPVDVDGILQRDAARIVAQQAGHLQYGFGQHGHIVGRDAVIGKMAGHLQVAGQAFQSIKAATGGLFVAQTGGVFSQHGGQSGKAFHIAHHVEAEDGQEHQGIGQAVRDVVARRWDRQRHARP